MRCDPPAVRCTKMLGLAVARKRSLRRGRPAREWEVLSVFIRVWLKYPVAVLWKSAILKEVKKSSILELRAASGDSIQDRLLQTTLYKGGRKAPHSGWTAANWNCHNQRWLHAA